jgi:hypothetical protein
MLTYADATRLATGKPLDLANELEAWRLLSAACSARLNRMPTTLDQDLTLLQREN